MSCPVDDPTVTFIQEEMEAAVQLESEQPRFTLRNLFKDKSDVKFTRRLVLCFMIQLFQQFTGINVIAFYGSSELALQYPA